MDSIHPIDRPTDSPVSKTKRLLDFLHRNDGSLRHKVVRSGAWVGLSNAGVAVLTFLRGIILARLLGPEAFGLMAVSLMATRLIEIFTETGFGAALVHRQQRFEEARDTAFTMMVVRGFGLAALAVLLSPWMARFYDEPQLTSTVSVSGICFVLMGFQNINTIALQKELDFKRLTYMELTGAVLSFLAAISLAYTFRNVWALIGGQIANALIASVLSFLFVPARVRFRFDWAIAKELYGYGRFITGLAIVVFLSRELDSALIGKLLGMETLGLYVAAYSLANIPSTYLSKVAARVMFPMFSKLQANPEGLRQIYGHGIGLITRLTVPMSVAMIVLADDIVDALYGPQWAAAAAPLRVLALFGGFRALWMLNGYLFNAIGKPQVDFYMSVGRLVALCVLVYPMTRTFGLVGAALATTIPMGVQFVVGALLSRALIGAPLTATLAPFGLAAMQSAGLAAILTIVKLAPIPNPRLNLLAMAVVCTVVTVAFNYAHVRELLLRRSLR